MLAICRDSRQDAVDPNIRFPLQMLSHSLSFRALRKERSQSIKISFDTIKTLIASVRHLLPISQRLSPFAGCKKSDSSTFKISHSFSQKLKIFLSPNL
jgi:hypothetical protein